MSAAGRRVALPTGLRAGLWTTTRATTWAAVLVVAVLGVTYVLAHDLTLGVAAATLVALAGVTLYDPSLVPVVAMPAFVVSDRIGGDSLNMTLSDVALFGAFWVALLFSPRPFTPALRSMLWLSAIYQLASLFAVVATPFRQNTVEWFHAWVLVGGALVVGWAVGRSGRATLGLTLLTLATLVVALNACALAAVQLAQGDVSPVYPNWPLAMHKNLAGPIFMSVALVAFVRQPWLHWPAWFRIPAFYVLVLGLMAVQSRQAIVGLGVGLIVLALRAGHGRHWSPILMLLTMAPAAIFVASRVQDDLSGDDPFNSTAFRVAGIAGGFDVWRENPWFGAGLRWWSSGPVAGFQPPNAVAEVLSSVGVVGLAGFAVLMLGTLVVAWRMDRRFGTLAVALLASRLVASQFDQFWVSIIVSLPFLLVGVCLGAEGLDRQSGTRDVRHGQVGGDAPPPNVPSPRSDAALQTEAS
ncbi:O-antigen ligase family protein [Krasilnikoviella flava]|uniref:O-antigen ligase n=1 Tax=Krasilnikoviella flava TaxID=526729 RepID=A0A1T5IET8_9MICO|nr:O-antigen ligase family protein [Krasilnikoviella flava]SKC37568.1 O-antigen ligase [Krasilnikoviella flava]